MRRFQCALLAVVAVIGLNQIASAADLPVKAPAYNAPVTPSWTGFYVGVNAGYGWGHRDVDYTPNNSFGAELFGAGGKPPPVSFNSSGALGGLQLGYNWQFNRNWLFGVETDFDWSGIKGDRSNVFTGLGGPTTATQDERVKWFGTARARLGYLPTDGLLVYVTGGFAYGRVDHSGSYINNPGSGGFAAVDGSLNCISGTTCLAGSTSSVATGWTMGGGLEYAVWQKWTLKAEYLYVNLDSKSVTETAILFTPGVTPAAFNANFGRTSFNVARVGLNYRF